MESHEGRSPLRVSKSSSASLKSFLSINLSLNNQISFWTMYLNMGSLHRDIWFMKLINSGTWTSESEFGYLDSDLNFRVRVWMFGVKLRTWNSNLVVTALRFYPLTVTTV